MEQMELHGIKFFPSVSVMPRKFPLKASLEWLSPLCCGTGMLPWEWEPFTIDWLHEEAFCDMGPHEERCTKWGMSGVHFGAKRM